MKIWLDAQLPPGICKWLTGTFGIECVHVYESKSLDADDITLFEALGEPGNVLATKDEDFVDLVTRLQPPPQILWLRVGNCTNPALKLFLEGTMPLALELLKAGEPVVELKSRPVG